MSESDYQQKIAARFGRFDRDGDGVVTEADFKELSREILAEYGLSPNSAKGSALTAGTQRLWEGFVDIADDGDGQITKQEFVQAASAHLRNNREAFSRMVEPWAKAVIAVADDDDDGTVTIDEWARMLCAMRAAPEKARAKAVALDTDGNGSISLDEILNSAVRLYVTDEPFPDLAPAR
ncbi:EF-hand domain-containing protein [Streptomyces sp. NPDC046727]|uniref:EF-hand domain-containing protein n=1 Tax=Streptomyces sp. NPDC046727 TaxID=3155373 RepID=UPI0033D2F37E